MLLLLHFSLFILITAITQIGGIVYLVAILVGKRLHFSFKGKGFVAFIVVYLIFLFGVNPYVAQFFGREQVINTSRIKPTSYLTILLNRNYVRPKVNQLLQHTAKVLEARNSTVEIRYLDANFPFFNKFPLLPHLSHNDGRKIDLSLVYQSPKGDIVNSKRSRTGYGVFESPTDLEFNQTNFCKKHGYFQYDYPKYLTMGSLNNSLVFSEKGTKQLMEALLSADELEKVFLELHLTARLDLNNPKIRFHGCKAVRHDDHIHIQVK